VELMVLMVELDVSGTGDTGEAVDWVKVEVADTIND